MNELLQNLLKLQAIEFEETTEKKSGTTIAELRGKIPPQILGHYDRLVARGKKGVTAVRGENCSSCHIRVPIGAIMTLRRGEDIQLCENCGRYLFLPDDAGSGNSTAGRPCEAGKKAPCDETRFAFRLT